MNLSVLIASGTSRTRHSASNVCSLRFAVADWFAVSRSKEALCQFYSYYLYSF